MKNQKLHSTEPPEEVGNLGQRIALTADDDEFFRMAIRAILTRNLDFAEVIEVGSFDEAVEKLSEWEHVSLALFDLQMPGMESAASVRTIREYFPGIKIVIVSSSKQKADIIGALVAGAHGYIPKVMGVSELAQALKIVIEGSIYVPPFLAELGGEDSGRLNRATGPSPLPAGKADDILLTPRQRQVLELLVQGMSNKQIARVLELGEGTIKVHMAALFRTLGVASRAEAAAVGTRLLANDDKTGRREA